MKKFAKIVNGIVDHTTNQLRDGYIEVPTSVFGGHVLQEDGSFTPPTPPPKPPRRVGEFREFLTLFTPQEQLDLISARKANPEVERWFLRASGGASLSLDHPDMTTGVSYMIGLNVISDERGAEIIAADFNNPPEFTT